MSLRFHWFLPTNGDGHLRVEGARLTRLPDPVPPLYFGGSSA